MKNIKLLSCCFSRFIIVGVLNTVTSLAAMFILYNILNFGYWGSSFWAYFVGSIQSYALNKKYTFRNTDSIFSTAIKFIIVVAICYFLSYLIAKPIVFWVSKRVWISAGFSVLEQISMVFGMCIFTIMNFGGQKFFAFSSSTDQIYKK